MVRIVPVRGFTVRRGDKSRSGRDGGRGGFGGHGLSSRSSGSLMSAGSLLLRVYAGARHRRWQRVRVISKSRKSAHLLQHPAVVRVEGGPGAERRTLALRMVRVELELLVLAAGPVSCRPG